MEPSGVGWEVTKRSGCLRGNVVTNEGQYGQSRHRRRRRSPETGQSTQANSNSRLTQLPPPFRQSRPGSRPPPRSKQSGHRFQHQNIGVNPHEDPPPAYTAPENAHEPQLKQKKKKKGTSRASRRLWSRTQTWRQPEPKRPQGPRQ